MSTALIHPTLSRTERRDEVRRLFFRHHLSMLEIARKIGVSKPTVWRDVRWLHQRSDGGDGCREGSGTSRHSSHDNSSPSEQCRIQTLAELNREMEDLKEEAWRAYARSLEPVEVETETDSEAGSASDAPGRHVHKKVKTSGRGDVKFLVAIGKLIEQQVKLFHTGETDIDGPARSGPPVVVYLPDNGRGPQPYDQNPTDWKYRKEHNLQPDETIVKRSEPGSVTGEALPAADKPVSVTRDSAGLSITAEPPIINPESPITAHESPVTTPHPPVSQSPVTVQPPVTNPVTPVTDPPPSSARAVKGRSRAGSYLSNEDVLNRFSQLLGREPESLVNGW